MDIFANVSITIGEDSEPRWYCAKCEYFKSETEPAPGTVCKQEFEEFSYELFRKNWREMKDEDIDKLDDAYIEWIHALYDVYNTRTCDSRKFYREKREGSVVHQFNSESLNAWKAFKRDS
uniref:Uncharacterized protein n=1 Tax=Marseillevirus LCMAC201 TaxID=2506605 RepID=A0A481YVZ1_9VIRU|nr:MAG: uncharacterized protein LCMAC201_02620 [Marseillevirus LCMAC201]